MNAIDIPDDNVLDLEEDEMGVYDDLPWDTSELEEIVEADKSFD